MGGSPQREEGLSRHSRANEAEKRRRDAGG